MPLEPLSSYFVMRFAGRESLPMPDLTRRSAENRERRAEARGLTTDPYSPKRNARLTKEWAGRHISTRVYLRSGQQGDVRVRLPPVRYSW
jgi:hypothetical protein